MSTRLPFTARPRAARHELDGVDVVAEALAGGAALRMSRGAEEAFLSRTYSARRVEKRPPQRECRGRKVVTRQQRPHRIEQGPEVIPADLAGNADYLAELAAVQVLMRARSASVSPENSARPPERPSGSSETPRRPPIPPGFDE